MKNIMTRTYLTKFLYLFHLNSSALYKLMYNDHLKNNNTYKWLDIVKSIFDECGLSYIWRAQSVMARKNYFVLFCTCLYTCFFVLFLFTNQHNAVFWYLHFICALPMSHVLCWVYWTVNIWITSCLVYPLISNLYIQFIYSVVIVVLTTPQSYNDHQSNFNNILLKQYQPRK